MRTKEKVRKIISICLSVVMIFTVMFTNINVSYAKSGTSLNKGDYIKFGSYNGEKILWRVIQDDDVNKRVMLISDRIITLKAFDANGENGGYGNNKWNVSNIRDWLNSEKNVLMDDDWSHGKPIDSWCDKNNYADEAGFLSNFLENERDIIVKMNDDGEKNENGNKVTILTKDELLLIKDVYDDYKAKPTKKAVDESEYEHGDLNEDKFWRYWTRTSYSSNNHRVYYVYVDGSVRHDYAYYGRFGVRPVLWLDTSNIKITDVDGEIELTAYDIDMKKPVIVNSRVEENILKDSVYGNEQIRSGVTATDDTDGDITSSIVVSGDIVDTSKLKDYTIRYNVEDNAGNKANEITRIVHVLKKLPKHDGYEIGTSQKIESILNII